MITHDDEGRPCLQMGEDRWALPRDSADLYRRSTVFRDIWGDDFLFVLGRPAAGDMPVLHGFSWAESEDVLLADTVAFNPRGHGNKSQLRAQAAFLSFAGDHPGRFPSYMDVREQTGVGAGYWLVSGGAFVLIDHDFGAGPEIRIPLFRRTFKPLVLVEASGMVAEPDTAAKEALEEWGLIGVDAAGRHTVYAVDFTARSLQGADYIELKKIRSRSSAPIWRKWECTRSICYGEARALTM